MQEKKLIFGPPRYKNTQYYIEAEISQGRFVPIKRRVNNSDVPIKKKKQRPNL